MVRSGSVLPIPEAMEGAERLLSGSLFSALPAGEPIPRSYSTARTTNWKIVNA
jgi:hypothetical protein